MKALYFFLFLPLFSVAQQPVPGLITPAIQMDASPETYALYLPRNYEDAKEYPTVFIFDPEGEGAKAVQQFTIGAELVGAILIAPNVKVGDSLSLALKESELFINKMYRKWPVNKSKIVLAGSYQGARLASSSAQLSTGINGIIAVGDVFIDARKLKSRPLLKVSILSGDESTFFYRLKTYEAAVKRSKFLSGFYTYSGNEKWPDAGYLAAALTDVLLRENTETSTVERYYQSDLKFGELLYKRQRHLEAESFVRGLKEKYKPYLELDEQKQLHKTIRANRTFKAKRAQRNEAQYEEQTLADDFAFYMQDDVSNAYFDNLGWWSYQMEDLDVKIDSTAANPQQRKSAIRLKNYVKALAEASYEIVKTQKPTLEKELYINVLRTLVNPENTEAFLNTISLSAKEGDENAALFYLEELLKTGYSDNEVLYAIDGTTALRIGKDWNMIIKDYLGKSKYY